MVYLNLCIAHVQLILNCSGTGTVWPEFITGTFVNSFSWSGCTNRLWGQDMGPFRENNVQRTQSMSERTATCFIAHECQFPSTLHPLRPRMLPASVCCGHLLRLSQFSCPVRPHMSCILGSCSELAWDELKADHVLFSEYFHRTPAKSHPRATAIPQHTYATELGAFWFNETSKMFFTLSPGLRPAEIPCHVSLQWLKILPCLSTLDLYSFFLLLSVWYLFTDTS